MKQTKIVIMVGMCAGIAAMLPTRPARAQAQSQFNIQPRMQELQFLGPGFLQPQKAKALFVAPGRTFSLDLPDGWVPVFFPEDPDLVEFRILAPQGATAFLHVRRSTVPPDAKPRQLLLRAIDERLTHLPHFKEVMRRDLEINGLKATSIVGKFWYQGNAQYPRIFEEMYFIQGQDAIQLHFECFAPLADQMAPQLNRIYSSFVVRPPESLPLRAPPQDNTLDKIPF